MELPDDDDIRHRLRDLEAAARALTHRVAETIQTLDEGDAQAAYRIIYRAHDLESELEAVRRAFNTAGISPGL